MNKTTSPAAAAAATASLEQLYADLLEKEREYLIIIAELQEENRKAHQAPAAAVKAGPVASLTVNGTTTQYKIKSRFNWKGQSYGPADIADESELLRELVAAGAGVLEKLN